MTVTNPRLRHLLSIAKFVAMLAVTTVPCSATLSAMWRLFLVTWSFVANFP